MQLRYSDVGTEPITATEVKSWLKIDISDDDTLIGSLITQIRQIAEEISGIALIDKTIEYFENDKETLSDWFSLPFPPHNAISEVKVNGSVITTDEYLKTGLEQFRLKISYAETDVNDSGVIVKYTTKNDCPEAIKLAMLKAIAETYEKRGNTFEGSLVKLDADFFGIVSQFKIY